MPGDRYWMRFISLAQNVFRIGVEGERGWAWAMIFACWYDVFSLCVVFTESSFYKYIQYTVLERFHPQVFKIPAVVNSTSRKTPLPFVQTTRWLDSTKHICRQQYETQASFTLARLAIRNPYRYRDGRDGSIVRPSTANKIFLIFRDCCSTLLNHIQMPQFVAMVRILPAFTHWSGMMSFYLEQSNSYSVMKDIYHRL